MSRDWYPYEFVLNLKDDSIIKNPHIVCFNEKGEIVGENNRELCEKYPYVAFFAPLISDVYEKEKGSEKFHEKCSVLNKELVLITNSLMKTNPHFIDVKIDSLVGAPTLDGLGEFFFARGDCKGKDPFDNQINFVNKYFGLDISRYSYEEDCER